MISKFVGYGVDLSGMKFKNLKEFVKKYTPDVWEVIQEDLKEGKLPLSDNNILDWLNDYEREGYYGLSAYLSGVINEQENIELSAYDSVLNGYLYIYPNYPWRFSEIMRSLTIESLNALFRKYISQITDDLIIIDYLTMYYDDIDD